MKRQQNCNFKLYPNVAKMKKKTGKFPLYLRLIYKGKKVETRLRQEYDLTGDELIQWDEQLMRIRNSNSSKTNAYLNTIQARWDRYNIENNYSLKHNLNEIVDLILERKQSGNEVTVKSFCDQYLENRIKPAKDIVRGTKVNYKKAVTHFSKFLIKNKLNDMLLTEFKHSHASDFKIYMGSDDVNNQPTSTTSNIIRLKTIFNEAINQEIITKNPFSKVKLTYRSKEKTPNLTINQIKDIINCQAVADDNNLIFYRDLFLFGCFTGLSVSNIKCLSNSVVFPIFEKRLKLDTNRVKTGKLIVQIITEPAQKIIEKYSNLSKTNDGRLFPNFYEGTFNEKMKVIGAHAGINISLSTKISRTTCNQILINAGGINRIYERAFMGWSNISDIQSIYTTLDDNILLRNTEQIESFINSNIGDNLLKIY